jgi:hypothetical protein
MSPRPEKFITPKEVQSKFEELGICYHVRYWRFAIKACPQSVKDGRFVKWSDIWTWWMMNPDFVPYSRKAEKVALSRAGLPVVTPASV